MTRPIKFRAWDKENQGMKFVDLTNCEMVADEDHELMQFTGLTDKNGVEIYEGDLLFGGEYTDDEKAVIAGNVEFKDGRFQLGWDGYRSDDDHADAPDEWGRYEVIGNIHQNPEQIHKQAITEAESQAYLKGLSKALELRPGNPFVTPSRLLDDWQTKIEKELEGE